MARGPGLRRMQLVLWCCELLCRFLELNLDPMDEQPVLSSTETHPAPTSLTGLWAQASLGLKK